MGELHTHKHTHQQDFLQTSLKNEFEYKTESCFAYKINHICHDYFYLNK